MCVWPVKEEDRKCGCCTLRQRCHSRQIPDNIPPDVGQFYLDLMMKVAGLNPLARTRKREVVWCRNIIAYQMYVDGFTQVQIAKALGINRSTVTHCVQNVNLMLASPALYPIEYAIWTEFSERITLKNSI